MTRRTIFILTYTLIALIAHAQEKRIVRGQLSSGVDEILTQDGVQQFLDEIFKDMDIFQNDIPLYSRFQDFLLPHPLLLKNKSCPKNHSPDSSLYKENNKINRSI